MTSRRTHGPPEDLLDDWGQLRVPPKRASDVAETICERTPGVFAHEDVDRLGVFNLDERPSTHGFSRPVAFSIEPSVGPTSA